jgi:hypothetical protein
MPRRDRTGPQGAGPSTGWGLGPCGGGTGFRRGFGCGFGRFWKFGSQVSPKDEKQMLEGEAKILEDDLKSVKGRLQELKEK